VSVIGVSVSSLCVCVLGACT